MSTTSLAVIVIRRPADWIGNSLRSFIVRIDGRRVGKVGPGMAGEFALKPGTHEVAVSMDWVRSRTSQVAIEPGSKTELVIRARADKMAWWKSLLPGGIIALIVPLLMEGIRAMVPLVDTNAWVRIGLFIVLYFGFLWSYILATSFLSEDYWALWTLEPSPPQGPAGS